jgi:hypothetical protein
MAWRLPDGLMDRTSAWNNENDRAEYMKAFESSPGEDQMMSMALICADPGTPESFIWRNLSNMEMPPRVGYSQNEPTIMDAISISSPRARGRGNQIQGGVN